MYVSNPIVQVKSDSFAAHQYLICGIMCGSSFIRSPREGEDDKHIYHHLCGCRGAGMRDVGGLERPPDQVPCGPLRLHARGIEYVVRVLYFMRVVVLELLR